MKYFLLLISLVLFIGCSKPEIEGRHLQWVEVTDGIYEEYQGYIEDARYVESGMFGHKVQYLVRIEHPRPRDREIAKKDHRVWNHLPIRLWVDEDDLAWIGTGWDWKRDGRPVPVY